VYSVKVTDTHGIAFLCCVSQSRNKLSIPETTAMAYMERPSLDSFTWKLLDVRL